MNNKFIVLIVVMAFLASGCAMKVDMQMKAQRLTKLGQDDEAIALYTKIIDIDPNYGPAHINLCVTYSKLNRFQNAIPVCNKALLLYPSAKYSRGLYGMQCNNYAGLHEWDTAEGYCKKSINIDPNPKPTYMLLIYIYLKANQIDRLWEMYEELEATNVLLSDQLLKDKQEYFEAMTARANSLCSSEKTVYCSESGKLYHKVQKYDLARDMFEKACGPGNGEECYQRYKRDDALERRREREIMLAAEEEKQNREQERIRQSRQDTADLIGAIGQGIQQGLNAGMPVYNQALQARTDADNYAREQRERQAREAREAQERLAQQQQRAQEARDRRAAEARERDRQAQEEKARNDQARKDAEQNFQVALNGINGDVANGGSGTNTGSKRDTSHCVNANYLTTAHKNFSTPGSNCDGHYYGSIKNDSGQTMYCVWAFEHHGILEKGSSSEYVKPGGTTSAGLWTCGGVPSDNFKYLCTTNANDDACEQWVGAAFR